MPSTKLIRVNTTDANIVELRAAKKGISLADSFSEILKEKIIEIHSQPVNQPTQATNNSTVTKTKIIYTCPICNRPGDLMNEVNSHILQHIEQINKGHYPTMKLTPARLTTPIDEI